MVCCGVGAGEVVAVAPPDGDTAGLFRHGGYCVGVDGDHGRREVPSVGVARLRDKSFRHLHNICIASCVHGFSCLWCRLHWMRLTMRHPNGAVGVRYPTKLHLEELNPLHQSPVLNIVRYGRGAVPGVKCCTLPTVPSRYLVSMARDPR